MAKPLYPRQGLGLSWRLPSSLVMGATAVLSRTFLYGLNHVEVEGLDPFLELLDSRAEPSKRKQGLLTVSNHISVLDDPLIWGILPLKYALLHGPTNLRWSLGANDILFRNPASAAFFRLGQVLPAYRTLHDPDRGGAFQPTVTHAIRLLSAPQSPPPLLSKSSLPSSSSSSSLPVPGPDPEDPAGYASRRHAWVHVFPEAFVHQHPDLFMRYFKWGVARMVLEAQPAPLLVPIFLDGLQRVMPEDRRRPRWLPRCGARVRVGIGTAVDTGVGPFAELRERWDAIRAGRGGGGVELGVLDPEGGLREDAEAVALRVEAARMVRDMVATLRKEMGYPEQDSVYELAETWKKDHDVRGRSLVDGGLVEDVHVRQEGKWRKKEHKP